MSAFYDQGALILCGGTTFEVPGCEGGFFMLPTVIENIKKDMRIYKEEIFGPVMLLIPFSTLEVGRVYSMQCSPLLIDEHLNKKFTQSGFRKLFAWQMTHLTGSQMGYLPSIGFKLLCSCFVILRTSSPITKVVMRNHSQKEISTSRVRVASIIKNWSFAHCRTKFMCLGILQSPTK